LIQCTAFGFSQTQSLCFSALASISPQGLEYVYTASWVRFVSEATPSSHFELWTQGANVGDRPTHFGTFPATAERQNSAILAILVHSTIEELYEEPVDDTSSICAYQLVLGEYLFFALETTGFGSRTTSSSLN
jgi:hypothetical protein